MVSAILNAMMSLFLPKLRKCKQGKKKKKASERKPGKKSSLSVEITNSSCVWQVTR